MSNEQDTIAFNEHPIILRTITNVAAKMGKPVEEVIEMLTEFSKGILNETQDLDVALYFLMSGIRLADYSDDALEVITSIKLSTQASLLTEIYANQPTLLETSVKLIAIPEPETEEEAMAVTAQVSQFLMRPILSKV